MAKASPFDATKRIVRPDGEVRYIRCVGVPLVENQSLKKFVGSAMDVTEHEILTRELRRREAYLAEAQRLSHTGSWAWNLRDGTLFWSKEIYRIYGFNSRETGPNWDQFLERVHPEAGISNAAAAPAGPDTLPPVFAIEDVAELQRLLALELSDHNLALDLADVTLVDREAVKFLAHCEADSIELENCPPYIREWIQRETVEKPPTTEVNAQSCSLQRAAIRSTGVLQ